MISLEKLMILTPFQKLPKYVGDLGKLIVVQSAKIAQPGQTASDQKVVSIHNR